MKRNAASKWGWLAPGEFPIYSEASLAEDDILYAGSDDDDHEDPDERRRRIEAQGQSFLRGNPVFLLSASLRGPFTKEAGWTNPWLSKSRTSTTTHETDSSTSVTDVATLGQPVPTSPSSPSPLSVHDDHSPSRATRKDSVPSGPALDTDVEVEVRVAGGPTELSEEDFWTPGHGSLKRSAATSWLRRQARSAKRRRTQESLDNEEQVPIPDTTPLSDSSVLRATASTSVLALNGLEASEIAPAKPQRSMPKHSMTTRQSRRNVTNFVPATIQTADTAHSTTTVTEEAPRQIEGRNSSPADDGIGDAHGDGAASRQESVQPECCILPRSSPVADVSLIPDLSPRSMRIWNRHNKGSEARTTARRAVPKAQAAPVQEAEIDIVDEAVFIKQEPGVDAEFETQEDNSFHFRSKVSRMLKLDPAPLQPESQIIHIESLAADTELRIDEVTFDQIVVSQNLVSSSPSHYSSGGERDNVQQVEGPSDNVGTSADTECRDPPDSFVDGPTLVASPSPSLNPSSFTESVSPLATCSDDTAPTRHSAPEQASISSPEAAVVSPEAAVVSLEEAVVSLEASASGPLLVRDGTEEQLPERLPQLKSQLAEKPMDNSIAVAVNDGASELPAERLPGLFPGLISPIPELFDELPLAGADDLVTIEPKLDAVIPVSSSLPLADTNVMALDSSLELKNTNDTTSECHLRSVMLQSPTKTSIKSPEGILADYENRTAPASPGLLHEQQKPFAETTTCSSPLNLAAPSPSSQARGHRITSLSTRIGLQISNEAHTNLQSEMQSFRSTDAASVPREFSPTTAETLLLSEHDCSRLSSIASHALASFSASNPPGILSTDRRQYSSQPVLPTTKQFNPLSSPTSDSGLMDVDVSTLPDHVSCSAPELGKGTPPSRLVLPSTPETRQSSLPTPDFSVSVKSFTADETPCRDRRASNGARISLGDGRLPSTQILMDANLLNPWLRRSPTRSISKVTKTRKRVSWAALPGEEDHDESSSCSSDNGSRTAAHHRAASPPPLDALKNHLSGSTQQFARHFATMSRRISNGALLQSRSVGRLLPRESQQYCPSPAADAMAEAFIQADTDIAMEDVMGDGNGDSSELFGEHQGDSTNNIDLSGAMQGAMQGSKEDDVSAVLDNLDDFLEYADTDAELSKMGIQTGKENQNPLNATFLAAGLMDTDVWD
ncbi:hypothetical protein GQ53DRAFT_141405 [Thozetella sp. PMI_491]|nr:hypothetical protein GQ53DRAFT_141405 [Thozetella sp. PMI_491]